MRISRIAVWAFAISIFGLPLWGANKSTIKKKKPPAPLTQEQRGIHALNRLTFGPRPGDLDSVLKMGVDKWIDQQLHPESIDDSALNARLVPLRTLRM